MVTRSHRNFKIIRHPLASSDASSGPVLSDRGIAEHRWQQREQNVAMDFVVWKNEARVIGRRKPSDGFIEQAQKI